MYTNTKLRHNKTDFWHLLSVVRNAMKAGQGTCVYPAGFIKNDKIFSILHREGLIQGFEKRGNYLVFKLLRVYESNHCVYTNPFFEIAKIRREGKKATLKFKHINKIQLRRGKYPCYIFSTDRGVLDAQDIKKTCIGGIPLVGIT
jgi:ribosomal protein S8